MKKRLLSAALALAMVLTLLPATVVPAAAYDTAGNGDNGKTAQYHAKFDSQITDETTKTDVPGWFVHTVDGDNKPLYKKITAGFIVGGKYYDELTNAPGGSGLTSFTVIGSKSAQLNSTVTSVTVDLYGKNTSCQITGDSLASVTVNDSKYSTEVSAGLRAAGDKATVTLPTNWPAQKSVSIKLTNVTSSSTVTAQNADANGKALGNSVVLDNASIGKVTLGKVGTDANKTTATQTVTAINGSVVNGITIVGNSSRVQITDSTVGSALKTGAAAVEITGTGASFTMAGDSLAGDLTLTGQTNVGKDSSAAPPSVTITAGTVGAINYTNATAANDEAKGNASVQLNSSSAYSGKITMGKGNVTIASGHASGVDMAQGTLTIKDAGATTGDLTLVGTSTTTVNVSGTGHTVGKITLTDAANVTLNIPDSRTNTYGASGTDLSKYTKHTIKGGTWVNEVPYSALDTSLAWQLQAGSGGKYTYYTQEQLGDALTAQVKGDVATWALTPTNSTSASGKSTLEFKSGTITWGKITGLATDDVIVLPSSVNSTTTGRWTQVIKDAAGASFDSGYRYTMPADETVVLDAGGGAASGNATKLMNAAIAATSADDVDKSVRVDINNNVITMTGSLPIQTTPIKLTLTTDVQKDDGTYATVDIWVIYNSADKKLTFRNPGSTAYDYGITVPDLDRLRLNNETIYTLSASVKDINAGVDLDTDKTGKTVEVTVSASAYATKALRDALKDALEKDAEFNWTAAPAIIQAINDVRGGTTDSQIKSWKDSANRTHYLKNHQSVPSTGIPADYLVYDKVYLVPYLAVTVNEHNSQGGTMKATLTPMYRIEARDSKGNEKPIVVQTGRSLGALTGFMSDDSRKGATVKFGSSLQYQGTAFGGTDALYAHQDGTYVYEYSRDNGMTITHAGTNGLGTFEINKTDGLVKLYDGAVTVKDTTATVTKGTEKGTYSTLQAAVDDAKNGYYIEVDQNYTGSTSITMTGDARTIYVQAVGKTIVVANATGDLVEDNKYGNLYSIKLNRDTAPIGGNITISSATGGSATVNANPAKAGQTVTVTLSASAGYTPSGVTVKTSGGQSVSVSGSGSTYTFTMPSGTVTVTPSFTQTQTVTNATVSVSNPNRGSGTAATSVGSNRVAPGTTVTVSTTPGSGQRTMGLNVTGATAYRTGENQFTFTVPSGYSNVVVTPTFDAQNGTSFSDVWSTEYFSPAVAWAVGRGITNGTSTYTFGSYNSCTREDMVTFLYRAAGSPAVGNVRNPFWDVQPGSYYYNAVMWAVSKGITNGVSATQFGVGQNVTRAQAVTFLYRYNGSPAASTNSGFYDVPSSEYFAKAVSWANATGVTNGTSTTAFSPNLNCQRAQIVSFLYRNATGVRA